MGNSTTCYCSIEFVSDLYTSLKTLLFFVVECHVSNEQNHGPITNLQTEFEEGVKLFCLPNNTYKTNVIMKDFREMLR